MMLKSNMHIVSNYLQKNIVIIPLNKFLLRFDGCSKGNPGISGAGAVIYHNEKEIWSGSKFIGYNESNNFAEYSGLILGLKKAFKFGIKELDVEGDSMVVIKQMNGEFKVNSMNLIELNKIANDLKNNFEKITFKHIYRENNTRADELSNYALKEYL